jgi:Zn finger protein HypA/HybF involved in hydrogenase expression
VYEDAIMPRVRLTIKHDPVDSAGDLRYAARVRHDLWAHSHVQIDPDNRVHGTHRDQDRNAYFEFVTDAVDEVRRVLNEFGHADRVTLSIVQQEAGEACENCGNIAGPVLPAICPNCGHRDIGPCPNCGEDVPRQEYVEVAGDLFQCPRCHARVRFRINPQIFRIDGTLNEPLVVTENA